MRSVTSAQHLPGTTRWVAALRIVLGMLTGLGKALDLAGFAAIVETYQLGLSAAQVRFAAYGVTAFELLLGGWLLSGWALRRAG